MTDDTENASGPSSDGYSILTFVLVFAGIALVFWLLARKRSGGPSAVPAPFAPPPPLVSPWSPLQ